MTHELDAVNTTVSKTDTAPAVRDQGLHLPPLPTTSALSPTTLRP